jgi:NADH dehydrogenase FAD-containing subunit
MTISADGDKIQGRCRFSRAGADGRCDCRRSRPDERQGLVPDRSANDAVAMDENIHVVGDASVASAMPKSGFSANSQAKVAANAIRGALTGSKVFPARFANTCWSLIATNDGVKVGAAYTAGDEKIEVTSKLHIEDR